MHTIINTSGAKTEDESDKLKCAFLSNISHEIRTPLNGILGFSQILNTAHEPEKVKLCANMIEQSSEQLLSVINDIIEISVLQSKQAKVSENEICLNTLLKEIMNDFRVKSIESNIRLSFETNLLDDECIIFSDEKKLEQIVRRILDNAFKFTEKGFVKVGYRFIGRDGNSSKNNSMLQIHIKDTGIGISAEKQKVVFKSFSQEDSTATRQYGGLGLGLSIATEYAHLLGGKITLKSAKGEGSTFFRAPLKTPFLIDNDFESRFFF